VYSWNLGSVEADGADPRERPQQKRGSSTRNRHRPSVGDKVEGERAEGSRDCRAEDVLQRSFAIQRLVSRGQAPRTPGLHQVAETVRDRVWKVRG